MGAHQRAWQQHFKPRIGAHRVSALLGLAPPRQGAKNGRHQGVNPLGLERETAQELFCERGRHTGDVTTDMTPALLESRVLEPQITHQPRTQEHIEPLQRGEDFFTRARATPLSQKLRSLRFEGKIMNPHRQDVDRLHIAVPGVLVGMHDVKSKAGLPPRGPSVPPLVEKARTRKRLTNPVVVHARPMVLNRLGKHMHFVASRQTLDQGHGVMLRPSRLGGKIPGEHRNLQEAAAWVRVFGALSCRSSYRLNSLRRNCVQWVERTMGTRESSNHAWAARSPTVSRERWVVVAAT